MKPLEISIKLNEEEFISYLLLLKKYKEFELIKIVLEKNPFVMKIDEDLKDFLNCIGNRMTLLLQSSLERILKRSIIEEVKDFINKVLKFTDIEDFHKRDNFLYSYISPSEYIERIKPKFCSSTLPREDIVILGYSKLITLTQGNLFGESSFENLSQKRSASAITSNSCHLGLLDKKFYDKYIKGNSLHQKKANSSFLLNAPFFDGIDKYAFFNKYYFFFVKEKLEFPSLLLKQDQSSDFIYFIKKGEFKVHFSKSLFEIDQLILGLSKKLGLEELSLDQLNQRDEELQGKKKENLRDKTWKILFYEAEYSGTKS